MLNVDRGILTIREPGPPRRAAPRTSPNPKCLVRRHSRNSTREKELAALRRSDRQPPKQNAPQSGGARPVVNCGPLTKLGGLLLCYLRPWLGARADLDRARLGRLRHFVNQVDMKHAIVEIGGCHLHVVGEAEPPLKSAPRDAAVQVAAVLFLLFLLRLTRNQKHILLHGDVELVR